MITVADGVVQALEQEGVSVVFGYPGAAILPLYGSLSQSHIRHVLVRQEQNAGHAASGYARISGQPGVVAVTSGPGACNLLTALATAYMDSIALVAITGQVSSELIGRDVFQEADITGAAEPFTKYSYLVKHPNEIARVLKEAFYIAASGRPGPVLIDLPVDILRKKIDFHYPDSVSIRGYKPTFAGNAPQVQRVAAAINAAERPLVCVGGGVLAAGAQGETVQLCEAGSLPMVSTMMGLSAVPSQHPLYFGMLGSYGAKAANHAVQESDLLIVVGARLGDRALTPHQGQHSTARVVHIDVDPAEIGKNLGASIPLVGDAKNIIAQLLSHIVSKDRTQWLSKLGTFRAQQPVGGGFTRANSCVNPKRFLAALSAALPQNAVTTVDVGQNQIWATRNLTLRSGDRLLTSGGMGTMGYALPAAVGALLADPTRPVTAILGDGALMMSVGELSTVVAEKLPLKIIVFNNHCLGMVRELETQQKLPLFGVSLSGMPDIGTLASAFSIQSDRLSCDDAIDDAIARLLDAPGPYLLECMVDQQEPSI